MKYTYLLILICFFSHLPRLVASDHNVRLEALDDQLEMLLPGTGLQEQSARIYAKERLQALFSTLEKRKISRKKPHKAIRIIKEEIEHTFFQTFTDFSSMDLLFRQGMYDQSTASALYVLVFNYFDLAYRIQIKASDIQLLGDPDNTAQLMSIPAYESLNEAKYRAFQMAYLNLLRTVNALSPREWDRSPEAIFHAYYLGENSPLFLKELASFLHYRQALSAYQQKQWLVCLDWIDRAQMASALPLYGVLKKVVWLQLANENRDSRLSLHYLWKLWAEAPSPTLQSELIKRFNNQVTQHKEISQWVIDSIYRAFEEGFHTNEAAKEQLQATGYLVQARFFAKKGKTVEVMNLMDSLYLMHPQDEDVQKVLAGMLVWSLKSERGFSKGLQRINYYEKKYPFLAVDPVFQDQHLFYRAERIRHHFDAADYVLGNIYLKEFEHLLGQMNPTVRYASWVSTVYISSSNYYFRQKEYDNALSLIEKALGCLPEDAYLLHRQNLLQQYLVLRRK